MILKFIDREEEMNALESAYRSGKSELFIIYGRRRMGKTELVKKFAEEKKHFYFLAKQQPLELEFARFREKLSKKFNIFLEGKSWEGLFQEITEKIRGRLVIIIDEFPFWVMKDRGIVSEFQYLWDEILKGRDVFLVLLGSYMSLMEQEVLDYKSPLFGRRTGQIYLKSMDVEHISSFFPMYSVENIVKTFGALDTIPYYLMQFDPKIGFERNILGTFLNKINPLYQDAEILLGIELREPNTYFNIIKSVLEGSTKITEIAGKSKVDVTNLPKYMNVLVKLALVEKVKPITSSPKEKNYLYVLKDNYFRFWLTYVYPYREEIEETPKEHLAFILKSLPGYMGPVFEEFIRKSLTRLVPGFTKIGKWWFRDNEIDIVAVNERTNRIMFGECKWQDNVDAEKTIRELKEKAGLVEWNRKGRKDIFAVFAKSFRNKAEAKKRGAMLFDLGDIGSSLGIKPKKT